MSLTEVPGLLRSHSIQKVEPKEVALSSLTHGGENKRMPEGRVIPKG